MKKTLLLLTLLTSSSLVLSGETSLDSKKIPLDGKEEFNPKCSYRVHVKEYGITSQVEFISKDKIQFEMIIDESKYTGNDEKSYNDFEFYIYSKNKAEALTDDRPIGYNSNEAVEDQNIDLIEYKLKLKEGSYIVEHSCLKDD